MGDAKLCMDQYYKLFVTNRIPNKNIDDIRVYQVYNIDLDKNSHIIIMFKNRVTFEFY